MLELGLIITAIISSLLLFRGFYDTRKYKNKSLLGQLVDTHPVFSCMYIMLATPITIALVCLTAPSPPLDIIEKDLKKVPTYSVVLEDLKKENLNYYEKYTIIIPSKSEKEMQVIDRGWTRSTMSSFEQVLPFLGMTVLTCKNGNTRYVANPPGYEYVGNNSFGHWENITTISPYWVWSAGSSLWGTRYKSTIVPWKNYKKYVQQQSIQRPYFGEKNEFGTQGSLTTQTHSSFYMRKNSVALKNKAHFSPIGHNRIGRSCVALRARSSRGGK